MTDWLMEKITWYLVSKVTCMSSFSLHASTSSHNRSAAGTIFHSGCHLAPAHTPMLISHMLPKLKQNHYHMLNVCIALKWSSSIPDVTAAIFEFGDLVKSKGRVRIAEEVKNKPTATTQPTKNTQTCWGGELCDEAQQGLTGPTVKSQSQPRDFLLI